MAEIDEELPPSETTVESEAMPARILAGSRRHLDRRRRVPGPPVERFSVTSHPHTGRRAIYGGHCKNLASISGEYQGKSGVISRVMQPLKNAAQ
jgi:hypothetical protein